MIDFAKITGATENNYIQVQMATGERLFSKIIVTGTGSETPSADWIAENKDDFLAVVTYEGDNYSSPIILGFYPTNKAKDSQYNTSYRMLKVIQALVEQLLKAKVNTQLGPQPFMPNTISALNNAKTELENIEKLIYNAG